MMVAAGVLVDLGGPAEFGREHDERGFQEAAIGQIVEQRGHAGVERGRPLGKIVEDVLVHVPGPEFHLDAPHARLDQPPGEQASLAERRLAIAVTGPLRFLRDVEGLQIDAAEQSRGVLVHLVVGGDLWTGMELLEVPIDPVGEREPSLELLLGEVGGAGRVLQAQFRVGHRHRPERGVEEAGPRMLVTVADEHVAGQVATPFPLHVQRPRTHRGVHDAVDLRVARPHEICALLVGPGLGGHRPDHGQPFGHPGEFRQMLAEQHAGRLRLDRLRLPLLLAAGLRVERVEMAHRPAHRQHDHAGIAPLRGQGGLCRHGPARDRVEHRHAQGGPRHVPEGRAARQRVVEEGDGLHGSCLRRRPPRGTRRVIG